MKEGQITIFKNSKKTEEKHPDYKGECLIEGKLKDVALWIKEGKNGKFFGGKISEKRTQSENNTPAPEPSDDIPF